MKGLFKKEWALMKWGIIALALLTVFIVLLGPVISSRVSGLPQDFFTNTLVIVGTLLIFYIFIGVGVLCTSLGEEMKRPDIWLHSPASMLKLVVAKALFAAAVTSFILLVGVGLLGISYFSSNAIGTISVSDAVLSLLSAFIALLLVSILVMAIGFFFWSSYQVIRSRFGSLARFLTSILFFAGIFTGIVLYEKLKGIGIYDAIRGLGPVKLTNAKFYNEYVSHLFTGIVPEGFSLSIGILLVGSLLTVILFVAGSMLFEKKVRL